MLREYIRFIKADRQGLGREAESNLRSDKLAYGEVRELFSKHYYFDRHARVAAG